MQPHFGITIYRIGEGRIIKEISAEQLREAIEALSVDHARIVAVRSSLRVLPLALSMPGEDGDVRKTTLQVVRSNFLSWAASRYPTQDLTAALSSAVSAARSNSYASAAHSASSFSAASALSVTPFAAHFAAVSAVSSARFAARDAAAYSLNSIAASSARSAAFLDADPSSNNDLNTLMAKPLFRRDSDVLAELATQELLKAKQRALGTHHSALLYFIDWWQNLLAGTSHSLFGRRLDLELAQQPPEFWGDCEDHLEPDDIWDRIETLLTWAITPDEAKHDPKDEPFAQRPASYTFGPRNSLIAPVPLDSIASNIGIASDLHEDILDELPTLKKRLERTQAPNWLQRAIDRIGDALGQNLADVQLGKLISRLASIEAAEIFYGSGEGREEVTADVPAALAALAENLRQLRSSYPALREAEIERIEFDIATDDDQAELASSELERIALAAERSVAVDPASPDALQEYKPEADEQNELITSSVNSDTRTRARDVRAKILSRGLQVGRNFVAAATTGFEATIRQVPTETLRSLRSALEAGGIHTLEPGERYALAALLVALAGPLGAIAAFSSPFKLLYRKLIALIDYELKRRDDENDDPTVTGSVR